MPTARTRRPSTATRRIFFRVLALVLGVVVLLAHTVTMGEIFRLQQQLHMDWPDLAKHAVLIASFALSYRLSYPLRQRSADWPSIALCSGWAALCEILQSVIPGRDFAPVELAANIVTPMIVVGLVAFAASWRKWFE
jgi:VanZ family protein